jgi:hypothetical protein
MSAAPAEEMENPTERIFSLPRTGDRFGLNTLRLKALAPKVNLSYPSVSADAGADQ